MRRWFAYIEESYDPEYPVGHVLVYPKPTSYALKGERKLMEIMKISTGEVKTVALVVGLGYADFKDEADYKERLPKVIEKKLREVGISLSSPERREGRS